MIYIFIILCIILAYVAVMLTLGKELKIKIAIERKDTTEYPKPSEEELKELEDEKAKKTEIQEFVGNILNEFYNGGVNNGR